MKKILTGLLALALVLTMSAPAFAATITSTQAGKTTVSEATLDGKDISSQVKVYGYSDNSSEVKTMINKVNKEAEAKAAGNADIANKKVNFDAPTLVLDIENNVLPSEDTKWTVTISNDALADGTYVVAHWMSQKNDVELQVVPVKNHSVQLTLTGASPVAFYAVSDNAAAASATAAASVAKTGAKSHKTGESLLAW